jgi:hypothetical protein
MLPLLQVMAEQTGWQGFSLFLGQKQRKCTFGICSWCGQPFYGDCKAKCIQVNWHPIDLYHQTQFLCFVKPKTYLYLPFSFCFVFPLFQLRQSMSLNMAPSTIPRRNANT